MTYAYRAGGGLEYYPCRYGRSRVQFRGPRRSLDGRYVLALGGTETYGLFVPRPWPAVLEKQLGLPCVNMGVPNAGLDLVLQDPDLLSAAAGAQVVVMQALPAQNMSNRYYSVHPRRNDRFLRASEALQTLFPELDFSEFSFTGHVMAALDSTCRERFARVVAELQAAWLARMKHVSSLIRGNLVLVWFAAGPPAAEDAEALTAPYLSQRMLDSLETRLARLVVAPASARALDRGTRGLVFDPVDTAVAERMPGPLAHEELAARLHLDMVTLLAGRS